MTTQLTLFICYTPVGYKKWREDGSEPVHPVAQSLKNQKAQEQKQKKTQEENLFQRYVDDTFSLPSDEEEALNLLSSFFTEEGDIDFSLQDNSSVIKVAGLEITLGFAIILMLTGSRSSEHRMILHQFKTVSKSCKAFASGVRPLNETFKLLKGAQTGRVVSMFEYGLRKASNAIHPELNDAEQEEQLYLAWTTLEEVFNILHDVPHLMLLRCETAKGIASIHIAMGHKTLALEWLDAGKRIALRMRQFPFHEKSDVISSFHEHVNDYRRTHRSGLYGLLRSAAVLLDYKIGEKKRQEIERYNRRVQGYHCDGGRKWDEIIKMIAAVRSSM